MLTAIRITSQKFKPNSRDSSAHRDSKSRHVALYVGVDHTMGVNLGGLEVGDSHNLGWKS